MSEIVGTGKHLSTTELRLWTSLLDASRILDAELEAHLIRDFDMSHRDYEVLVRLDGHGGSMRMSVLARQIEASPQLITQTVDRLVDRGWLLRQPSTVDRRGVEAALTAAGRNTLAEAAEPHAALVRRLLISPIAPNQLEAAATSLGRVADHLRQHRAGVTCDDPTCPVD